VDPGEIEPEGGEGGSRHAGEPGGGAAAASN
jgi:hypothetical protein